MPTDETIATDAAGDDDVPNTADTKPRTATVLGLLALTSLTFSYLGAYAVLGALVRSEVLPPWNPDADPRPKWLVLGFFVLMATFVCAGAAVRQLSRRQ